jgi:hypothetical protein
MANAQAAAKAQDPATIAWAKQVRPNVPTWG